MIQWHYLPERPNTAQDVIFRRKCHEFCDMGYYSPPHFMRLYNNIYAVNPWADDYVPDDDIECWCGVEEVAAFFDGK